MFITSCFKLILGTVAARLGILEGTVAKEGQSGALRDAREGPTY